MIFVWCLSMVKWHFHYFVDKNIFDAFVLHTSKQLNLNTFIAKVLHFLAFTAATFLLLEFFFFSLFFVVTACPVQ